MLSIVQNPPFFKEGGEGGAGREVNFNYLPQGEEIWNIKKGAGKAGAGVFKRGEGLALSLFNFFKPRFKVDYFYI